MNKLRKIAVLIGWSALSIGVFALLGFVGHTRSEAICEKIIIRGSDEPVLEFLPALSIEELILEGIPDVVGKPMAEIDSRELELEISKIAHVKKAKVFKTMNHELVVEIEEYDPFLRVIDRLGRSAWIDRNGTILPISKHKALRLPIISGDFSLKNEWISNRFSVHVDSLQAHPIYAAFEYGKIIDADPFWKAQIQFSEVNARGEITATPQVGQHTIVFGSTADLLVKLRKLAIFYDKALGTENWNAYTQINLKFKDQIVCTKR